MLYDGETEPGPIGIDGGMIISCADDPYDLRPAVKGVLDSIDKARANLRPDQPLVVLMGEYHPWPTHRVLQYMLVEQLHNAGKKIACGFEISHNILFNVLTKHLRCPAPPEIAKFICDADRNGDKALLSFLAIHYGLSSPVCCATLMKLCRRLSIASRFNDLAIIQNDGELFLDNADPFTWNTIISHPEYQHFKKSKKIDAKGLEGVKIRNTAIVNLAAEHLQYAEPEIYLQFIGNNHVAGNNANFHYLDSLTIRFSKAGIPVLPVFTSVHATGNVLSINHLAEDEFYYEDSGAAETAFIQKLACHSSFKPDIYNPMDPQNGRSIFQNIAAKEVDKWLEDAKKSSANISPLHPSNER